jgi:hypothetical protein
LSLFIDVFLSKMKQAQLSEIPTAMLMITVAARWRPEVST